MSFEMSVLFLLFLVTGSRGLTTGGPSSSSTSDPTGVSESPTIMTTTEEDPCQFTNLTIIDMENSDQNFTNLNCSGVIVKISDLNMQIPGTSGGSTSRRRRGYTDGQLSKADYELYMSIVDPIRFSLHVGVLPVLTLAIVSFSREKVINDSTCYMIAINALEFFCSFLNAVLYVMKYTMKTTDQAYIIWILVSNYGIVCGRRSVYILTLVLCVQRYNAVASPMKARQMVSMTTRITVLTVTLVTTFGVHVYLALMYDLKHMGNDVYVMVKSSMYANDIDLFDGFGYVTKTGLSYIPLFASLVVNIILIFFMKRHNKQVQSMRSSKDEAAKSKQDRQMTWMILVSTMSFTLLSIPSNINYMISTIDPIYGSRKQEHYLYSFVRGIVNALQTVADFINFLCYILLSSSFRRKVRSTLWCDVAANARRKSSGNTTTGQKPVTNSTEVGKKEFNAI